MEGEESWREGEREREKEGRGDDGDMSRPTCMVTSLTHPYRFLYNCTAEYSKVMDSYLYTHLGRYNIVLIPMDLLPVGSPIGGEKNTIYVNRFRHALIGVDFSAGI